MPKRKFNIEGKHSDAPCQMLFTAPSRYSSSDTQFDWFIISGRDTLVDTYSGGPQYGFIFKDAGEYLIKLCMRRHINSRVIVLEEHVTIT